MNRPLRVLHCPTVVGGNSVGLAQAERALGLASDTLVFERNLFPDYPSDQVLWRDSDSRWRREWNRWAAAWKALRQYDIVHFNFGRTLMPERAPIYDNRLRAYHPLARWAYWMYANCFEMADLTWLRMAGRGVVVTYQGDDARQGEYLRQNYKIHFADDVEPDYYEAGKEACKRRRIAKVGKKAHRILALNPDLLHVLPAGTRFMPYASVDPTQWQPTGPPPGTRERPIILHAPTNRAVKGTRFVVEAVARLQAEGIPCDLLLVEGMTHLEARKAYEQADLLIDQVYAGWYGGLAVELMSLGKPVIAYIREEDLAPLDPQMRAALPIIRAEPNTLYQVLKLWLTTNRGKLAEVGRCGRQYVETWHDPLKIASWLIDEVYTPIAKVRP